MHFVASPSLDLARVVERHLPSPDKHNPSIVVRVPSRLRQDRTGEPSQVVPQCAFRLVASPVQKRAGYAVRFRIGVAALLQVPLDYLRDTSIITAA